jgi:hypothetical protein
MIKFQKELTKLINKYSLENKSNTPDFILASYLVGCLRNFEISVQKRTGWGYEQKEKEVK